MDLLLPAVEDGGNPDTTTTSVVADGGDVVADGEGDGTVEGGTRTTDEGAGKRIVTVYVVSTAPF